MNEPSQRAFALPTTIFVLAITLSLALGATYMARQELRIGTAGRYGTEAFYLAERGLSLAVSDWDAAAYSDMSTWADTTIADTLDIGTVETRITRVGSRLYLLESTGTVTEGGAVMSGATREAGTMVRLITADLEPPASLTTRGGATVRGNARVHGEDLDPADWGGYCPDPLEDKPGILSDDSTLVGTSGGGTITGLPAVGQDSTISEVTFTRFGDLDWDELTALADITLPGGSFTRSGPAVDADGACDLSVLSNWGDPLNPTAPCGAYFPIIHVTGNASMQSNGRGQGVLLVDGSLDLRGDFVFYGIIIVQESLETQGSGNKIFGGVMAGNADLSDQRLVGGSVIRNSTCAVSRAVLNNAALTRPRPLAQRSWVDLSAVSN